MYQDLAFVSENEIDKEKVSSFAGNFNTRCQGFPIRNGCTVGQLWHAVLAVTGIADDFPLEQYYRDIRIHPIHEGTGTGFKP